MIAAGKGQKKDEEDKDDNEAYTDLNAIEGVGARFVELMNWDFSDPLHVDGSGILSSVSLGPTAAVPEPPVWVLFAGGLGALCRARRQRS